MFVQIGKKYLLGDYRLEPDKRLLSRDGQPVHLTSKPFQVLLCLIEHRDRVVSRAELLDRFWDGKDVYDDTLRKCVGAIRKALDDHSENPRFIRTCYSEGYRYIGPVEEQTAHGEPSIIEIERTRGVKIVVEEEEIQNALPEAEQVWAVPSPAKTSPLTGQERFRWAVALAVVLAVALTTIALILYRSRANRAQIQPPPIRSLAVLPLKNLTGDPAQEYFSDGVTESLITELAKINGLKVISRGSVFTFKDKEIDPRDVGQRLGVIAVLEGSVRKSGDAVRVEVRLVSAEDGRVLWVGDSYNLALRDILRVQDEIGCRVAAELKVKLCGEGEIQRRYTENVEAYKAYLKGRYFLNKRTPEGITKGTEYFQQAIAIDPNYALAYAGLADSYGTALWFMSLPPNQVMTKWKEEAARALELDDTLAEAHVAMASFYGNSWDLMNAVRESERAIELNPGNADVHHNYAYVLQAMGRSDEAIAEIKRAWELDPLNIVMNVDVGEVLLYARRYDEAIEALTHALEMDPNRGNAHYDLAQAYEQKGMYPDAVAEYLQGFSISKNREKIAALREAYAAAGMRGFWQKRLEQYKERSKQGYVEPTGIAVMYARLGEKDQALEWLEKAYQERSPNLAGLKGWPPALDPLRSDPRFADLVRRVGDRR